jgi:hypothetical protein
MAGALQMYLKEDEMKVFLGLLTRHVLTSAGGALVAKGLMSASMVEPTVGAIMTLAGLVWSVLQKRRQADASSADLPSSEK